MRVLSKQSQCLKLNFIDALSKSSTPQCLSFRKNVAGIALNVVAFFILYYIYCDPVSLCHAIVTCWVWTPLCCEIWVTMFTMLVWSIEIWISWIWFIINVFIVSSSGEGMFIVCIQHSFIVFHFNNLHTERENNKIALIKTSWQIAARIICFNWKFRKSWPELWLTVQLRRNILVMCLELVPICIIFISHICCLHTNLPAHTSALVSPLTLILDFDTGN